MLSDDSLSSISDRDELLVHAFSLFSVGDLTTATHALPVPLPLILFSSESLPILHALPVIFADRLSYFSLGPYLFNFTFRFVE